MASYISSHNSPSSSSSSFSSSFRLSFLWVCHTGKIVPPQRPYLILPSHVPHVELDILIGDGLDVEADGGDGGDVGVELELIEDCYGGSRVRSVYVCGLFVRVPGGGLLGCIVLGWGEGTRTGLSCGVEA